MFKAQINSTKIGRLRADIDYVSGNFSVVENRVAAQIGDIMFVPGETLLAETSVGRRIVRLTKTTTPSVKQRNDSTFGSARFYNAVGKTRYWVTWLEKGAARFEILGKEALTRPSPLERLAAVVASDGE
jgi:hypothetical protein